jgi:endonuclease YncB( thermonuclease family)
MLERVRQKVRGWIWKKPTGFDWHQYVQTTIKLRRQQRRQRVVDVGQAAVDQAQAAAAKVAAGSLAAGVAAKDGAMAAASSAGQLAAASLQQTPEVAARYLGQPSLKAARWTARIMRPFARALSEPAVAGPLSIAGGIALISGLVRLYQTSTLVEAWMPLAVGAALLVVCIPSLARSFGFDPGRTFRFRTPTVPSPAFGKRAVVALGAAAVVVTGLGALAMRTFPTLPGATASGTTALSASTQKPTLAAKPIIEGRGGQVTSGDTLRLDGRVVRLSGVEAPDRQQLCTRGTSKRWRCGEAAQSALERVVKSKTLRCVVASTDASGRSLATCTVDGRDIAADLLKDGHVFSTSGYFGSYASLESAARAAKIGLWAGEAERPADYRSRLWEAAKQTAPDGCPIKATAQSSGQSGGQSGKSYVLPWASDYARTNVRATRGDRWFCSEQDAIAAGFKPSERN